MIEITFLGTGPVGGIEASGRSRRRESSAMVRHGGQNVLIDVTSDFDAQIRGFEKITAVLLTHGHSDAVGGMACLGRWWRARYWDKIPVYGLRQTIGVVKRRFRRLEFAKFVEMQPGKIFPLLGLRVKPFPVSHSIQPGFPTVGYAFFQGKSCKLVYVSDVGEWDDEVEELMKKADILVMDGATWKRKMVPHQAILQVLPRVCGWKNKMIVFTQIGRSVPEHEKANRRVRKICPRAELAYDGRKLLIK